MTAYPPAPPPGGESPRSGSGGGHEGAQYSGGPPVCPRHPDQVSYVNCQRCGRPVCPGCQRIAPVGVHCVDCHTGAQQAARPERTQLGGRQRTRPYVTFTMMALCIGVYLLEWAIGTQTVRGQFAFSPLAGAQEPWRMITTAFLHGGVLHLALNMYALWITGPFLERYLGAWRFAGLYLLSAFAGSVAVVLLTPVDRWDIGTVGASGAVFGLFAACALLLRRIGGNYSQFLIVIAINVVISFTIPLISWQAHMGGMVAGAAITLLYFRLPKKHRTSGAVVGLAAVFAVLALAAWVMYSAVGV